MRGRGAQGAVGEGCEGVAKPCGNQQHVGCTEHSSGDSLGGGAQEGGGALRAGCVSLCNALAQKTLLARDAGQCRSLAEAK